MVRSLDIVKTTTRDFAMVRCHLARMMGERKMRITDVARETGLSRTTVTSLYKETAQKVDLEALDKLCEFFDCSIGELLERATPIANKYQVHDTNQ